MRLPRQIGSLKIREVEARTALTRSTFPGIPYSLNPYIGCAHACPYCFVPNVRHTERPEWGSTVEIRRNLATVLADELRRFRKDKVFMSTATDPYQFVEGKCRVTRRCVEVLQRAQWPLRVLTRSPLVLRDADLFLGFDDVCVGMSVPTLDDAARRIVEPRAPPIPARLRTLRALADRGLRTFVSFAPAYPPTGGWTASTIAEALSEAGVQEVHAFPIQMRPGIRSFLSGRLQSTSAWQELASITDRHRMGQFLSELRSFLERRGVRTGSHRSTEALAISQTI